MSRRKKAATGIYFVRTFGNCDEGAFFDELSEAKEALQNVEGEGYIAKVIVTKYRAFDYDISELAEWNGQK